MKDWTYGYELELGDISRNRILPSQFGTWEYAECDIVNIHGEYAGLACDPRGLEPPVGGEINVYPAHEPEELTERIVAIMDWFLQRGDDPSASCVNHGHVHVRIPGLRDDPAALRRLTAAIGHHQDELIRVLYQYKEHPLMAQVRTARTYLKWDGGRPMPAWMVKNIVHECESFEDFIRLQCCGKDGVSRGRPFRYAINTYCLKHTDTIEFRCYRASLDPREILSSITFARDFLALAIYGGDWRVDQHVKSNGLIFPKFIYNHEHYTGWETTKWPKERGKKERHLVEI